MSKNQSSISNNHNNTIHWNTINWSQFSTPMHLTSHFAKQHSHHIFAHQLYAIQWPKIILVSPYISFSNASSVDWFQPQTQPDEQYYQMFAEKSSQISSIIVEVTIQQVFDHVLQQELLNLVCDSSNSVLYQWSSERTEHEIHPTYFSAVSSTKLSASHIIISKWCNLRRFCTSRNLLLSHATTTHPTL